MKNGPFTPLPTIPYTTCRTPNCNAPHLFALLVLKLLCPCPSLSVSLSLPMPVGELTRCAHQKTCQRGSSTVGTGMAQKCQGKQLRYGVQHWEKNAKLICMQINFSFRYPLIVHPCLSLLALFHSARCIPASTLYCRLFMHYKRELPRRNKRCKSG